MNVRALSRTFDSKIKSSCRASATITFFRNVTTNIAGSFSFLHTLGFILLLTFYVTSLSFSSAILAQTADTTSSSSSDRNLPTIQIISPQNGQQVPLGELTIQGISSDNEQSDCQVFADVNDITPMRNVTAAGSSGEESDFSKWTFTYTKNYQLIKSGENELTAKISCQDDENFSPDAFPTNPSALSLPLSEWHTINVTGLAAAPPVQPPSISSEVDGGEAQDESSDETDESIPGDDENSVSNEEANDDQQGDTDGELFGVDPLLN